MGEKAGMESNYPPCYYWYDNCLWWPDTGGEVVPDGLYPECGICGDVFHQTNSPLAASQSANTSTKLSFGLRLPCPSNHAYCIGCLSQYIISKLDPESSGKAPGAIVFPIRCPECSLDEWSEGLQDETAEKVLTKEHMVTWVRTVFVSFDLIIKLHFSIINSSWIVNPTTTALIPNALRSSTWMKKEKMHLQPVLCVSVSCAPTAKLFGMKVMYCLIWAFLVWFFRIIFI